MDRADHSGQVSAKEPGSFSAGLACRQPGEQELLLLGIEAGESPAAPWLTRGAVGSEGSVRQRVALSEPRGAARSLHIEASFRRRCG